MEAIASVNIRKLVLNNTKNLAGYTANRYSFVHCITLKLGNPNTRIFFLPSYNIVRFSLNSILSEIE